MFLLVLIPYTLIGIIEITPLVKARQVKKLLLYSVIFFVAFVISLLLSFNVKIPSPAKPMNDFYESIVNSFSS